MESYKTYKDSGIEWIGDIPEHWEVKRIRHLLNIFGRIGYRGYKTSDLVSEGKGAITISPSNMKESEMDFSNCTYLSWEKYEESPEIIINNDDVLFVKTGSTYGKSSFVECLPEKATINPQIIVFKDIRCNNKLLWYITKSNFLQFQVEQSVVGGTIPTISQSRINNYHFPIALDLDEQTTIANYLDKKTTELDQLITQKETLLTLYEEEKTAIINHAVTKGINPNVPLKDSDIDWLGEIPEHWEVKKLKYVAKANPSNIDKKRKEDEQDIYLCNYVDVYKNDFISNEIDFMKATASDNQIEKFILKKGDVITTKDSESPDDIAVPSLVIENFDNVVCGYHLTHIRSVEINGDFLFRFFQTVYLKSYFEISANGVTRYGLGVDKFNSALIFCPPKTEQTQIVQYIETETAKINAKAEKTKKLITLLKEYKSALISEVVTGKIKVC